MKREPQAVYMKKNNQYEELSYEEYMNSGRSLDGGRRRYI